MSRTPLYSTHIAMGAKMVPFGGWDMPVWYKSIKDEHLAVRTKAGLFDISHMGLLKVTGSGAYEFLLKLSCNSLEKAKTHKMVYSMMLNEKGGILDDVMIGGLSDGFLLVVNAGNTPKIEQWIATHQPSTVHIEKLNLNYGFLALQGPKAVEILKTLLPANFETPGRFSVFESTILGEKSIILRTGYTGEDGAELIIPIHALEKVWMHLIELGVQPCGLGARDSLRIEAGLPLYGQELSENLTPFHTRYEWVVKFDHEFIGDEALQAAKNAITQSTVGLQMKESVIARPHYSITEGGEITSGTLSPLTGKSVAMALVSRHLATIGQSVTVDIRGKACEATVVEVPFK